jgi:hypothetical protein
VSLLRFLALVTLAGGCVMGACSTRAPLPTVACQAEGSGCACYANEGKVSAAAAAMSCNPSTYPGTTCCAAAGWPTSNVCTCSSNAIVCGIVPGYFEPLEDGGAPLAGCVCSTGGSEIGQGVGATCEPGGWSSPPSSIGVCCLYPANFMNEAAGPTCACGPSFVCAAGTTKVPSCSAASFPAPAPVDCNGQTPVASCHDGDGGDDDAAIEPAVVDAAPMDDAAR